jgi:predicted DNA-binding transcriptional regulator AlpA
MIEISGKKYLTQKEVSYKYGMSTSWLELRRWKKDSPPYVRLQGKGKVFYPEQETELWFKNNLVEE